ncbi:MAG: hypothetical protein Q8R20_00455 [Nanoarchaeota archaeon]|nr:hypothetical protein [Nanoarchaeota archaeon]
MDWKEKVVFTKVRTGVLFALLGLVFFAIYSGIGFSMPRWVAHTVAVVLAAVVSGVAFHRDADRGWLMSSAAVISGVVAGNLLNPTIGVGGVVFATILVGVVGLLILPVLVFFCFCIVPPSYEEKQEDIY